MKKNVISPILMLFFLSGLTSCQSHHSGKIIFDLNGGQFPGQDFSASYLDGEAGSRVMVDIPNPEKEGYFFVGWREVTKDGGLRVINLRYDDQGNGYYVYPYGSDTFFAYFEPLSTIRFDLTEGSEKNGAFVEPKLDADHFDQLNGVLNGYVSKSISSLDYLPTATADHMTFQYWYTDYPLVSKTTQQDGKNITHYSENTEAEKGVYPFDQQFGTDLMEFPESVQGDFTLYAYWTKDPLVTVHYNVPGVEDSQFYFKDGMASKLKDEIKVALGLDLNQQAEAYYYPRDTKDYRFAGVYLDETLQDVPFYFNSTDPVKDVDCYLKWDKLVPIHFDYDGGTYLGETSSDENHLAYMNDSLNQIHVSGFTMPVPEKENNTFLYFSAKGEKFDADTIITSALLDDEGVLNLKAVYQSDLKLTIHYDFPDDYDDSSYVDDVQYFKEGEDITSELLSVKASLSTDPSLSVIGYYTKDSEGKHHAFDGSAMPDQDLEVYLEIDYLPLFTLCTRLNDGGVLSSSADLADQNFYLSRTMDSTGLVDPYTDSENHLYLFDGFYEEESCLTEFYFPVFEESTHDTRTLLVAYRKYTKSVTMTLHFGSSSIATLPILPGHTLSEYKEQIQSLTGYSSFRVYADESHTIEIRSQLPSVDSDLYLVDCSTF